MVKCHVKMYLTEMQIGKYMQIIYGVLFYSRCYLFLNMHTAVILVHRVRTSEILAWITDSYLTHVILLTLALAVKQRRRVMLHHIYSRISGSIN